MIPVPIADRVTITLNCACCCRMYTENFQYWKQNKSGPFFCSLPCKIRGKVDEHVKEG